MPEQGRARWRSPRRTMGAAARGPWGKSVGDAASLDVSPGLCGPEHLGISRCTSSSSTLMTCEPAAAAPPAAAAAAPSTVADEDSASLPADTSTAAHRSFQQGHRLTRDGEVRGARSAAGAAARGPRGRITRLSSYLKLPAPSAHAGAGPREMGESAAHDRPPGPRVAGQNRDCPPGSSSRLPARSAHAGAGPREMGKSAAHDRGRGPRAAAHGSNSAEDAASLDIS